MSARLGKIHKSAMENSESTADEPLDYKRESEWLGQFGVSPEKNRSR